MNMQLLTIGSLLALVGLIYSALPEKAIQSLGEAEQVAALSQAHELEVALELYYLTYGHYPTVNGNKLVEELFETGKLKQPNVLQEITYSTTNKGKRYSLTLE